MTRLASSCILGAVALMVLVAVILVPPIPQDPAYHLFADNRTRFGVPNFSDVVSNLPFLIVALVALRGLFRLPLTGTDPGLKTLYLTFFVGVLLTAFGSGWYHLSPSNESLVWDRLPMTIAFMAFFAVIIGEHINVALARGIFPLLLFAGVSSVVYWQVTEQSGVGDLRPYILVQFLPMLLIPLILLLFPTSLQPVKYYWWVILLYAASKLAEHLDSEILLVTEVISGHSLKHILAAMAPLAFYLALRRRTMARAGSSG